MLVVLVVQLSDMRQRCSLRYWLLQRDLQC